MKRLDMQDRNLTKVWMVTHVQPTLHQGHVEASCLHGLDRFGRAGRRVQLDGERTVDRRTPQRHGDPMPRPYLLPGCYPQSCDFFPLLMQGNEGREAKRPNAKDGK
jgi:hypothetical protein